MAHIQLIYGDEPQLIEEEKRKFLSAYPDLPVTVLDDEAGPQKISEKLCEDSLFGDQKVFCLVNLPIIRKSGKNSDAWVPLYELIMEYNGDNPIVLIYHDMIDKRIKQNKELLNKIPNLECKRLEGADLVMSYVFLCIRRHVKAMRCTRIRSSSHRFVARCTCFFYEN